jgi:hypothetical protein
MMKTEKVLAHFLSIHRISQLTVDFEMCRISATSDRLTAINFLLMMTMMMMMIMTTTMSVTTKKKPILKT